jgi:hypothetical protein
VHNCLFKVFVHRCLRFQLREVLDFLEVVNLLVNSLNLSQLIFDLEIWDDLLQQWDTLQRLDSLLLC